MLIRNAYLFSILTLLLLPQGAAARDFAAWQKSFASRAIKEGVSEATLERHFFTTSVSESVIALDRKQPEDKLAYRDYLSKAITPQKIERGRALVKQHRRILDDIARHYKVDPEIIVALWGIETDYGKNTGSTSTLNALATLAYEGRRHEFFSTELITLLKLLQSGEVRAKDLQGSWAGAMGQTQFMPSSFTKYAVDYDKDGKKDIWNTEADVFASIANYLHKLDWHYKHPGIIPASVPANLNDSLAELDVVKPVSEWAALGVTIEGGAEPSEMATLLALERYKKQDYALVFHNFKVLLDWNYSRLFAGAALHLAHGIKRGK